MLIYEKCKFWIYACKLNKNDEKDLTFQVRTFNLKHKCARKNSNFHLTSQWLAQKYIEEFRADPTWSGTAIKDRVKKEMKLNISRMKAWRARDFALK